MERFRQLYVPFAVTVLLLVCLVVWLVVKPRDNGSLEEDSITFVSVTSTDLALLQVDCKDGTCVKILPSDGTGDNDWILEGYDPSEVDDTRLNNYVSALTLLIAESKVKDPASLSEYGLDAPDYTISITDTDGNSTVVLVGSNTYDGSCCYMKLQSSDDIYLVTSVKKEICAYTYLNFLDTLLMHIDYGNVASVVFERMSDNMSIEADCALDGTGSPRYSVTQPYSIRGGSYLEYLIDSIANMQVSSFMNIGDGRASEYGLDEPAYRVTFHMKHGDDVVVELSSVRDGYIYGSCSANELDFCVASGLLPYLNTSLRDLLSNYVVYYAAYEVSSITCSYGDRSFRMDIDTDGAITDEEATVTIDGRNCRITTPDNRSFMAILYESVACIEIGGFDLEVEPVLTDDPFMTLTVITKTHETINVAFEPRGTDSYYAFINGEYSGYYVYSDQFFENGGQDTYSYGIWPAYDLLNNAIMNSVNGVYDIPEGGIDTLTEGAA